MLSKSLLLLIFLIPAICLAQENNNIPAVADEPAVVDEPTEQEADNKSIIDRQKEAADDRIQRASQWVDSFFADPNFEAESANTFYRIRPELYYRKEQGAKPKIKVRVKFHLPGLSRNASLVIGSEDTGDSFNDTADDSSEDAVIGLQFFGKQTMRWNTSISVGLKFNEFAVFAGPRVRYQKPWGEKKSVRFTQGVRYQTNKYWNTISRLDLNFILRYMNISIMDS